MGKSKHPRTGDLYRHKDFPGYHWQIILGPVANSIGTLDAPNVFVVRNQAGQLFLLSHSAILRSPTYRRAGTVAGLHERTFPCG